MAAIVAGDLTYTISKRVRVNQMSMVSANIAFTTSTQTYPATGVPLPAISKFGLKKAIDFVNVMSTPGDGYVVKYDKTNHSLRIYQAGAVSTHTHDIKVLGGGAFDSDSGIGTIASGGPKLSKTAATDQVIAGADSATKGGVVAAGAVSAGGLAELGAVAVPTLSVDLQIWGE